jgi:phage host-nuclease inhibitor protein Gam
MNTAFTKLHQAEIEDLNEFFREVLGLPGLDSAADLDQPEVKNRFKIIDDETLNWVMRKLGALKATINDTEELAKSEIKRINDWKSRQVKPTEQSIAFFEQLVEDWANEQRAENAKFKSKSTPYGRVTFTKRQPEWLYRDESKTADFLLDLGYSELAIEKKEIANKTELKKAAEIKRNVFVRYGKIVDFGTVNEATGDILGMDFALRGDAVIFLGSGEIVEDVAFMATAAALGSLIVPGIEVNDRPDAVAVKPEI